MNLAPCSSNSEDKDISTPTKDTSGALPRIEVVDFTIDAPFNMEHAGQRTERLLPSAQCNLFASFTIVYLQLKRLDLLIYLLDIFFDLLQGAVPL